MKPTRFAIAMFVLLALAAASRFAANTENAASSQGMTLAQTDGR